MSVLKPLNENRKEILDLLQSYPSYKCQVKIFIDFLKNHIAGFSRIAIEDYLKVIEEKHGKRASTYNLKVIAVKSCLKWLFQNSDSFIDLAHRAQFENFLQTFKLKKKASTGVRKEKYLTPQEVDFICSRVSQKLSLIVRFLFTTGCRISEVVSLTPTDCKESKDVVIISVMGKGRKQREVYCPKSLFQEIISTYGGRKYLFETHDKGGNLTGKPQTRIYVSNQIGKATEKYLGKTCRSHSLRHGFAKESLRKNGRLSALSSYLGHSSLAVTQIYVHDTFSPTELFG